MEFVNKIAASPSYTGIIAASLALLYFILMMVSPSLPPALVFSAVIGYFVYAYQAGTIGCQKIVLPAVTTATK